jgi:outer membrane protein assembly factor BamB
MNGKRAALIFVILVCPMGMVVGDNWPQFRGPSGSAMSAEKDLPVAWSASKNVAWKVKIPGYGWSSPIVWGDKVFVTTAVRDQQQKPTDSEHWKGGGFGQPPAVVYQWQIYCLGASDGKVVWKRTAIKRMPSIPINSSNTHATETPVTDGRRVYAYFGMIGVFCYDLDGKQLWHKDLGAYKTDAGHGSGASPALEGRRLFIQCDNEVKSFLVALDTKTGKEMCRIDRTEATGWSTPLIWKNKVRTEVVCLGRRRMQSYDPATGKQLWELGGMNGQAFGSPVADANFLYAGTGGQFGGGRPLFAVKAGASGDITLKNKATSNEGVAWYQPKAGPLIATPLLYEGHLYIVEQQLGILNCYDAKTGKRMYRERLPRGRGFLASPWTYEGKVFCLDEDGQTFVVQPGPKFKLLGRNQIEERCWSSPAIAGGALFLRTVDHLYCVKNKL